LSLPSVSIHSCIWPMGFASCPGTVHAVYQRAYALTASLPYITGTLFRLLGTLSEEMSLSHRSSFETVVVEKVRDDLQFLARTHLFRKELDLKGLRTRSASPFQLSSVGSKLQCGTFAHSSRHRRLRKRGTHLDL